MTLNDYILATRRLLHDANGEFWSDSELTDYINEARRKLCKDTGCYRLTRSVNFAASTDTYAFPAATTLHVLDLAVIWGQQRYNLKYMAFSDLNRSLRNWTNFTQQPVAFCEYNNSVIVAPIPDQIYATEWDCVELPNTLVTNSDVEVIPARFTDNAKYYAAYLAKIRDQALREAEAFENIYKGKTMEDAIVFQRRLAYGS